MTSLKNLFRYGKSGVASPDMTDFDKLLALQLAGGGFPVASLSGQPPLSFKADGTPLISWSMKGNGQQTGTPTPDAPIMPTFCGMLNGTDWTIPLTCAGQTVPVYLGQTPTVRRVRKLVLDGTENWSIYQTSTIHQFYAQGLLLGGLGLSSAVSTITPYGMTASNRAGDFGCYTVTSGSEIAFQMYGAKDTFPDVAPWKAYLADKYAAGTPVTVWYVLATPTTGIVNEPLAKIGDYADELSSTDAGVAIPTVKGQNTLTVDTTLQPSEMSITGHIKAI